MSEMDGRGAEEDVGVGQEIGALMAAVPDDAWEPMTLQALLAPDLEQLLFVERREAVFHARRLQAMNEIRRTFEDDFRRTNPEHQGVPDYVYDAAVAEIAALRRVSRGVVQAELADAATLVEDLPLVFSGMLEGKVWRRHAAAIIAEASPVLDVQRKAEQAYLVAQERGDTEPTRLEELRRVMRAAEELSFEYQAQGIDFASERSPAAVRSSCARLANRLAGVDLEARRAAARQGREVRIRDAGDGMSELVATISTTMATAINDRLTQQAAALSRVEGESRTYDQLRADVFTDMLLTSEPSEAHPEAKGIQATVAVTVPFFTLAGLDHEPALLNGVTPMALDEALEFAAVAPTWLRILTDPVTGVAREVDNYRPTAGMRALIGARDVTCRFVGCRRPARRCDIDHAKAWAEGGKTSLANLESLCEHHHRLKHASAWTVAHDPERFGDLVWTSPAGRVYQDHAQPIGPTFTATDLDRFRGQRIAAATPSADAHRWAPPGATSPRSGPPDSGPPGSDSPDSGPPDSAPPGSGSPGSGSPGSGSPGSGSPGSGPPGSGQPHSVPPDSGPPGSGPPDFTQSTDPPPF